MDDARSRTRREAGIAVDWIDATDKPQRVSVAIAAQHPDRRSAALRNDGRHCREPRASARAGGRSRTFFTAAAGSATPVPSCPLSGGRTRARRAANGSRLRCPCKMAASRAADRHARLSPSARRRTRDHAGGRAAALRHARATSRRASSCGGSRAQLYALRRAGDGGIGDTGGACATLVAAGGARRAADAIALSPTHSLFAARSSAHYGPYSPSSRLFLNPLYADPARCSARTRVATLARDTSAERSPAP